MDIFITIFTCYVLLFLLSLWVRDNSLVDIFWGGGFMMIGVLSFLDSSRQLPQLMTTGLVCIWWIRIITHIWLRKWKEKKEDARYTKWRAEWGNGAYFMIRSFLQVYMLQMILMCIVATPILVVNLWLWNSYTMFLNAQWFGWIALIFWISIALSGLLIETIADRQLAWFISVKKPWQIFMGWLYRYSRHPNYFGESMFWLGISIISLPVSLFGIIGWITITFLLLFVSGVPLQEARYIGRVDWEEYKKRTSVFVPWFPKK